MNECVEVFIACLNEDKYLSSDLSRKVGANVLVVELLTFFNEKLFGDFQQVSLKVSGV